MEVKMEDEKLLYEMTDKVGKPMIGASDLEEVKKEDMFPDNQGFVLYNVLSKSECEYYIKLGEEFGLTPASVSKDHRDCDRVVFKSPELASLIWDRVKPYVEASLDVAKGDDKKVGVTPHVVGKWNVLGLNEAWRLCKYTPGGHFGPHRDGIFSRSFTERSMKTFMLYLNDGYEGGTTNFINEEQMLFRDPETNKFRAEEKNITNKLQPKAGMCLIFNHSLLHEGARLVSGVKYILRSDVMYQREGELKIDPKEERALKLYEEARDLEAEKMYVKAAETYQRAFRMWPDLEKTMFGK
eukprot:TRINITY_DN16230_c0_g1_i1.p1 TRINITY_DN16230_c0_g1~~TRINITY_DN16230_c0_g1_i1.p1  ORF type:complete len:297 (+),score=67.66 TRINITY_DN16230_c0_g1_i1:72-962(+)